MSNTRVEVILGCMFSGKSTELLRRTNRYRAIGKEILLINHSYDNRTDESIKTHSNMKQTAIKTDRLESILELDSFKTCDVIGIDEAQFFPDLLRFVKNAELHSKIIIVAGLDGDYKREPIGEILQVIPLCDEVVKLNAMDMIDRDGSPGIFSKRIVEGDDQVLVGANESYAAVSRKNYFS
tara:strand:- start:126 stop:668 length:543 start_codon:yes stop_codon:yes gene_type:complete